MDREELEWLNEDFKAAERIGPTPDACLRWVLQFAQTDLQKCSKDQWRHLCTEVHVFTSRGPLLRIGRGLTHLGAAIDWGGVSLEQVPKKKRLTLTFRPSMSKSRRYRNKPNPSWMPLGKVKSSGSS